MAAAAAGSGSAREDEFVFEFCERELEVAAILADLPSIVRASNRRRRQQEKQQQREARPEIPSWGRRRPRRAPAAAAAAPPAEKPVAADDDGRSEGVASPDTPLAFPEDGEHDEAATAAAAEDAAKACAQDKWAQEQRGVVASLSHENAHLLKQIEDFRARLHTSRSTNDSLKQIHQSKHKKRHRPEEEEDEGRGWKLQARAADRPALDLNEPAEADAEDGRPPHIAAPAAAQWYHRGQQQQQQQLMQMQHKAARRRRQEIRRAKAAAGRARRQG